MGGGLTDRLFGILLSNEKLLCGLPSSLEMYKCISTLYCRLGWQPYSLSSEYDLWEKFRLV